MNKNLIHACHSVLNWPKTYFSGLNEQVESQKIILRSSAQICELFPRNYGPPWGLHLSLVLKKSLLEEIFAIGVHFFGYIVNVDVQCAMRTKKCKNFSPRNDIGGLREPFENLRKKVSSRWSLHDQVLVFPISFLFAIKTNFKITIDEDPESKKKYFDFM